MIYSSFLLLKIFMYRNCKKIFAPLRAGIRAAEIKLRALENNWRFSLLWSGNEAVGRVPPLIKYLWWHLQALLLCTCGTSSQVALLQAARTAKASYKYLLTLECRGLDVQEIDYCTWNRYYYSTVWTLLACRSFHPNTLLKTKSFLTSSSSEKIRNYYSSTTFA